MGGISTVTMSRQTLSGDVWGGFAAMLVALPSAIAFGVTIMAPLGAALGAKGALAGMLGVAVLGLVAALLGGTQRLISAPCAPAAAVLSALTLQQSQAGAAVEQILVLLFLVAVLSSLIQVAFGLARVGQLIKFMPYPVVSGYLSGVGLIIILSQLPKWLALPKGTSLWQGVQDPSTWHVPSLLVGAITAGVMVLAPRLKLKMPPVILGLLGGVVAYWLLALTVWPAWASLDANPHVIGALGADPASLLASMLSPWQSLGAGLLPRWELVLWPALTLAVLLSIDTLKTCVVLDAMTGTRHQSNRELIGQGLGNLASTMGGGMPGAGTMGATLVNKASGGTTSMSGVFQGLWALLAVFVLTPLIAWVPVSSLAALLTVIGVRMIDWHSLHWLKARSTRMDFGVIAVVVLVANTWSLIAASGLGVGLAILMFIREQIYSSTVRRKSLGSQRFSKRVRTAAERALLEQHGTQTAIVELQGSLFFGTTDQLYTALEPELRPSRRLILDFLRVQSLDVTAEHMLHRVRDRLHEMGGVLVLTRLPQSLHSGRNLKAFILETGIADHESLLIMEDLSDALEWSEEQILAQARVLGPEPGCMPLQAFELLSPMSPPDREQLARVAQRSTFAAGDTIVRCGGQGDALMLLGLGEVSVLLPLNDGHFLQVATLGRGAHFAEMSFLDGQHYSADVRALTACEVWVISRRELEQALAHNPLVMATLMKSIALALADRLRQTNIELREMRES